MKFTVILLLLSLMVFAVQAGTTCSGDGAVVQQLNGMVQGVKMPCKYHAVKQKCGQYFVNLSPSNTYVHPEYYVDSIWLGLRNRETREEWEGTVSNSAAYKYLTGTREFLFNKKSGALATGAILTSGKDDTSVWVEAQNGDFKVTFTPWETGNADSPRAQWRFECLVDFEAADYPTQICGGDDAAAIDNRATELELRNRQQAIFYDVFNKTEIAQTNPQCVEATRLMTKVCTEELRRRAIATCSQLLYSDKSTSCNCVTQGSCDRMEVFLDCMTWVCSDLTDQASCDRLGLLTLLAA